MPAKRIYFTKRNHWRKWLKTNFEKETELWLVFPKKASGKTRISYNDAVEEALCFGWIDSTVKSLNENHTIQRFTPRRPGSSYSQINIERLRWLADKKRIHPSILEKVKDLLHKKFVFPPDILAAIRKDRTAWKNYKAFGDAYKRIRIAYIESARKRPEEFVKRLTNFIQKTKENKLIRGYGGSEKYY